MSGNLPSGTSAADIDRHYGGGIPDHDHEWVPVEEDYPVLEDMAALFCEEYQFAEVVNTHTDYQRDEVYEEHGQECDETRWYRFELAYVELPGGNRPDRDKIDRLEMEGDEMFETVLDVVIGVERAFPEDTEVVDIDPDPDVGQVVIQYDGYELGYGGEV